MRNIQFVFELNNKDICLIFYYRTFSECTPLKRLKKKTKKKKEERKEKLGRDEIVVFSSYPSPYTLIFTK